MFTAVGVVIAGFFRPLILSNNPGAEEADVVRLLQTNGDLVTVSTLIGGVLSIALIVLFAWLRRGISVREYLALGRPDSRVILTWLMVVAAFVVVSDGLKFLLGYGLVTEFATDVYTTSGSLPLLWIAVIVVAPVSEEFLFCGFLFAGWSRSRLGVTGTILLTSLLWAVVHPQYDLFIAALVFVFGIIAGLARHRTGSIGVPILIHGVVNLVVTLETMLVLRS